MELLNRVLQENVKGVPTEELIAHRFPSKFVEVEYSLHYHNAAFTEACQVGNSGFRVVQPETGLIYVVSASDCSARRYMPTVLEKGRGWSNVMFSSFGLRIRGRFSWVPSILLQDVPDSQLAALLSRDFYFSFLSILTMLGGGWPP